ncbi:MAG: patatin-like phospholipase family protein [Lentisphaeria bacterium]|nr:patatin-like phospholipase family protein [Lentisphaeria bacterium]
MKNNFGLVFAGGGGKGAWQLGVWKALEEAGIRASAVSGTSVGALNAALYAQGDYQRAVDAWMAISNEKLLTPNIEGYVEVLVKTNIKKYLPVNLGKTVGIFSQEGLKYFVETFLKVENRATFLPAFITCHNKTDHCVEYFNIFPESQYDDETIRKILLASAAIPLVFDNVQINGKYYSDGGFDVIYSLSDETIQSEQYNNAPIEPLAENAEKLGLDTIILLALNRDELTKRHHYGFRRVLPLLPSQPLGGIIDGCLDFDPEHAKARIDQGYRDARKWLEVVNGFFDDENQINEVWERIENGEEDYLKSNKAITSTNVESSDIEKTIVAFNKIVISDTGSEDLSALLPATALEDRLLKGEFALIDSVHREELNHLVDILVDENRNNSQQLTRYVMDAAAALAPVESRASELLEQGFFGRLWHGITGKNSKMVANSVFDLAKAQYASIRLIQKLQHENLLQFEMTEALSARLYRLAGDAARIQSNVNHQIREIYGSMALIYCKFREKLHEHEKRISKLERNVDLHFWTQTIKVKSICGIPLDSLPAPLKLLSVVTDFYFVCNGEPDDRDLLLLRSVIKDCHLDKEQFSIRSMAEEIKKLPGFTCRYKEDFRIGSEDTSDPENYLPALFDGKELNISGADVSIPAPLLASELLYLFKANNYAPRKFEESGIKADYLSRCENLRNLINKHPQELSQSLLPEIVKLEDRIKDYYFKIYLLGPFSCGKSSLLNAWLGQDLLLTGLAPETAVASELIYSRDEKIVLYPMQDNMPTETLPGVSQENLNRVKQRANAGELQKVQIFLNNPRLQRYPGFCLVDMPGLSSALPAHENALNQFIMEGGYGIFCVPMHDGTIQEDGLAFLRRMAHFPCGFNLLMTKADEKVASDHQAIINECKNAINNTLGIPLEYINSGIVSVKSESGTDDFNKLLDSLMENRDFIFHSFFKEDFQSLCCECMIPLKKLLSKDFDSSVLEAEIERLKTSRENLPKILSRISAGIDRQIPAAVNSVVEKIKTCLFSLQNGLKSQIKSGQNCSGEISANMKSTMLYEIQNKAYDIFSEAIRQAAEQFGEKLSFNITAGEAAASNIDGMKSDNYMGTGALIGGVIGLIGGPLGAAVGGFIGGWIGKKIDDDSNLDSQLLCRLEEIAEGARPTVEKAFYDASEKFKADLKTAMENKLSRLEEQNQLLRKKLEEDQAEFDACKSEREAVLDNLNTLTRIEEQCNEPV